MVALGIDIGGMSIKGAAVDKKGKVLNTFTIPVTKNAPFEKTVGELIAAIKDFCKQNNYKKEDILGVGVGCPGLIDTKLGEVISSANLKWDNAPLRDKLSKELDLPVRITNDANAATLGEAKFGSGKKYRNVVMLTLGTGIGGGVVIDGELYEGYQGKGTELGHITMVLNGRECGCGRRGCFETYASATGLMNTTKEIMKKYPDSLMWKKVNGDISKVDGKLPFDCEKEGDKAAKEVVDTYVSHLSEGIMNYCNIFRPEVIILSGGVAKQGKNLTDRLIKYCRKYSFGYERAPESDIVIAEIGYESGMIGAAALFL